MPYTVVSMNGKWHVHKKGPDGKPVGRPLGSHDFQSNADAQAAAIGMSDHRRKTVKAVGRTKKKTSYYSDLKSYWSDQSSKYPDGFDLGMTVKVNFENGTNVVGKIDGWDGSQFWICTSEGLYIYVSSDKVERLDIPQKSALLDPNFFVTMGSDLKTFGDGRIGGHLVLFGTPDTKDFSGDYFTQDTYLGPNHADGRDVTINHRLAIKTGVNEIDDVMTKFTSRIFKLGGLKTHQDDLGVFGEVICNLSDAYDQVVYDLADRGKLKWSSGAARHMIDRDADGQLKMFVVAEAALTPAPMEPRMVQSKVMPLKSFVGMYDHL